MQNTKKITIFLKTIPLDDQNFIRGNPLGQSKIFKEFLLGPGSKKLEFTGDFRKSEFRMLLIDFLFNLTFLDFKDKFKPPFQRKPPESKIKI
jgi:hypothetical protein